MQKVRLGLFVALALLAAAGCRNSPTPAKVSGRVTYKGQPLKGGEVAFHSDQGTYRGSLSEDGAYEMTDLPAGEFTVTVNTEFLNPAKKAPAYGGGRGDATTKERLKAGFGPPNPDSQRAQYTKIPKKYASVEASGLKATLGKGKQTKDFELKD
jgi:hypothetical protein